MRQMATIEVHYFDTLQIRRKKVTEKEKVLSINAVFDTKKVIPMLRMGLL